MMLAREKVARNGIELEGLILDLNGNPVSASDEILSKLSDPDEFKKEVDKSTIEIVTSPHLTVLNSARELIDQAGKLEETMQGLGYLFLPIDTAISSFVPDVRDTSRYTPQKLILGDERFSLCGRVNGTHIHFSQEPDKIPEQVNYILAADPAAIALTSSSPLNGLHNWRLHTYRNIVYQSFPFQGHLQNLKPSYDAYLDELDRGFREFQRKARKRGVELNDSFDMFNSIWGPTRLNQNLGTVEARTQGSTPFIYNLTSYLTLLEGGMRRVRQGDVHNIDHPLLRCILQGKELAKASASLAKIHNEALQCGTSSPDATDYIFAFLSFAYDGLADEEKNFVEPFMDLTFDRRTAAGDIRKIVETYGNSADIHLRIHGEFYLPQRELTRNAIVRLSTPNIKTYAA